MMITLLLSHRRQRAVGMSTQGDGMEARYLHQLGSTPTVFMTPLNSTPLHYIPTNSQLKPAHGTSCQLKLLASAFTECSQFLFSDRSGLTLP